MCDRTPVQEPAIVRARRVWKDGTADVYRTAVKRHGTASSWLKDHAGRRNKGVKAPDQLARLVREMAAAGYTLDEIDHALVQMTRGITRAVTGTLPAA